MEVLCITWKRNSSFVTYTYSYLQLFISAYANVWNAICGSIDHFWPVFRAQIIHQSGFPGPKCAEANVAVIIQPRREAAPIVSEGMCAVRRWYRVVFSTNADAALIGNDRSSGWFDQSLFFLLFAGDEIIQCPFYCPGDFLQVREKSMEAVIKYLISSL